MLLERELEVEQTFGHESYHIVLGVADVEDEPLLVLEPAVLIVVLHANCLGEHLLFCVIALLALFLFSVFRNGFAMDFRNLGVGNFGLANINLLLRL